MWGIIMGQSHTTTNTNMGLFNSSKDIGLNKTTILPARSSPNLLAGHEFSRHFSSGHAMMNNSTKTFPTFINRNNSYNNNDNMNNYRQKNLLTPNSPQRQSAVTPLVCEKEHVGCKMSESRQALDYVVLSTSAPCLARQSTSLDYSRGKLEQDSFMSTSTLGQSPSLDCWGGISQVNRDSTISSLCLSPPHLKISKPILALTTWPTQAKADQSETKELGGMAEGKVQMGTKADKSDNSPSPGSFVELSDLDTDVIFESFRQLKVQEEILPTEKVQLEKSCENIIVKQLQNRKLPEPLLESLHEDLTEQRDEEIDRNFEQICEKSRRKHKQKRQKQRGKKKSHKRRRRCRNRRNFVKMASTPAVSSAVVANPVHPDKHQTPQTSVTNNDGDTTPTLSDSKPKEISSVQVPITITSEPSLSDDDISTEKESDEERDETDYVSTNFSFDDCFECIANGMKEEEFEEFVEKDDDNNESTNDSDSETEVITSENDNNDNVIDETELEKETERDSKGPKITRPNSDRDLGKEDTDSCPEKTCDQKEDSDDEDDDGIVFDYGEVGASDEIESGETEQDLKGAKISSGKGDRDLDEEDSDADSDGCPQKNRDQEKDSDSDDDDRIVFDYSEVGGSSPTPTKSRKFQCSSSKGISVTCDLNFVDSDSDSDHDRPAPSKKHKLSRFFDESDSESDDEDGENSDSDSDEEDSDSDEEDEDQNDDPDEEDDDDDDDFICFVRDDVPEPSPPVHKKSRSKKSRNFPGLFPSSSPPRSFFGSGRPSLTSHFHMTLSVDLELPSKTSEDIPEDIPERSPSKRKVRFAPDSELVVVRMVEWEDRKGPWEECVRDTARFKKRIRKAGRCISKVLRKRFRERIYRERFATDSEL